MGRMTTDEKNLRTEKAFGDFRMDDDDKFAFRNGFQHVEMRIVAGFCQLKTICSEKLLQE